MSKSLFRSLFRSLFLALRRLAIPVALAAIAFLETYRPGADFRLATFVLLFALLADITSLSSGRLRDLLLVATALALGVTLLEAAAHVISPMDRLEVTQGFAVRDPVLGWAPERPGRFHAEKTDPSGKVIYDVTYTFDGDRLRATRSCTSCASVAFFGDSFTFGEGLDDEQTLPQAFADAIGGLRILNLGFSGYGPQQFLRAEETGRFDAVIGPRPKLFVFLTAPWHAQRSACKASWVLYAPRYSLEKGKLAYDGACFRGPGLWLREWMAHTASYRVFVEPFLERLDHDDMELYIRILEAAVQLAKAKYGVPTLIPYIRVPEAYLRPTGFTNDAIIERLEEGGAHVVDVTLARREPRWIAKAMTTGRSEPPPGSAGGAGDRLEIAGDGHPTAYANRLRAAILKRYIEDHFAEILPAQLGHAAQAPHAMPE